MRKLMTLDDLYSYYASQNNSLKFEYDDNNAIVVQVGGQLEFSKDDNSKDGLYPVSLKMCFVGDNLNGSRIEKKAMENALSSAKFRPILGYIHEVDGQYEFYGHNMHVEDNELVYDEVPVGVIAEEAKLEYDEENQKDYAVSSGYIFEEYSPASEILKREQNCNVSVELSIRSLSYNAEDKILNLDDFFFSGCTILGVDDNGDTVHPAMPGSNITIADFSSQNNSLCASVDNEKLIASLDRLNETLSKFNINNIRKEDTQVDNPIMEENFEEVAESTEEVTEETTEEEVTTEEEFSEDTTDVTPNEDVTEEFTEDEVEEVDDGNSIKCSVTIGDIKREFSVSMNAKIEALSSLVNDIYTDDMTWYCVEVYDDEKQVVMIDCWSGKAYRQSYKVKDNVFSLKGDRVSVHSMWVTDDEQSKFDKLKSDFELTKETLAKYEAEPEKMSILNSEDYSQIAESEDFVAFKEQDAHFDMSVEDVKAKADAMLLDFAKHNSLKFSAKPEENHVGHKSLFSTKSESSRYGDIFKK